MANGAGDVYQVRIKTVGLNSLENYNVWFYRDELGTPSPDDAAEVIATEFVSDVIPSMADVLSVEATISEIEVTNLFDAAQLYVLPLAVVGTGAGDVCPPFTALSMRTSRVRRDIRRGQKRFGPISEGLVTDGVLDPAGLPLLQPLADAMENNLDPAAVETLYQPIIVKRIAYTTPSGNTAYRLPETLAELEYFLTDTWEIVGVTTQNSRKR